MRQKAKGKQLASLIEGWKWARTPEANEKRRVKMSGVKNHNYGKVFSKEHREKMSMSMKGRVPWNKGMGKGPYQKKGRVRKMGKDNPNWKGGLEFRKKDGIRNDSAYAEWRRQVWLRDNFKCKIANPECKGRIEAHHILGWRDYPELRYQPNNGITLCHAHHPRKRSDEAKLSPYFQQLVAEMK